MCFLSHSQEKQATFRIRKKIMDHKAYHMHRLLIRIGSIAAGDGKTHTVEELCRDLDFIERLARCALDGTEPCPICDGTGYDGMDTGTCDLQVCSKCKGTGTISMRGK